MVAGTTFFFEVSRIAKIDGLNRRRMTRAEPREPAARNHTCCRCLRWCATDPPCNFALQQYPIIIVQRFGRPRLVFFYRVPLLCTTKLRGCFECRAPHWPDLSTFNCWRDYSSSAKTSGVSNFVFRIIW